MWNWPWKGSCLEGGCFNCQGDNKVVSLDYQGCLFSLYFPPSSISNKEAHLTGLRFHVYSRLCARLTLFIGRDFISQCTLLFRNHFIWSHWWKRLNHFMVHECATMPLKPRPSPNSLGSAQRGTPLLFQGIWFHRGCWNWNEWCAKSRRFKKIYWS